MAGAEKFDSVPNLNRSKDHVAMLALRLVCLSVVVALLTIHVRSVRVFRWEQSVSGGVIMTYVLAVVGLALCAGVGECGAKVLQLGVRSIYGLRLLILATIVVVLRIHIRSIATLRLTNTPSGLVVIMNVVAILGLTLCVGMQQCGVYEIIVYLCGAGGVMLAMNTAIIWNRWRHAGDMTRVVAELLGALGVPLRRQILIKATLSATAAVLMLIDLAWILMQHRPRSDKH